MKQRYCQNSKSLPIIFVDKALVLYVDSLSISLNKAAYICVYICIYIHKIRIWVASDNIHFITQEKQTFDTSDSLLFEYGESMNSRYIDGDYHATRFEGGVAVLIECRHEAAK